jgi:hypothetical protein
MMTQKTRTFDIRGGSIFDLSARLCGLALSTALFSAGCGGPADVETPATAESASALSTSSKVEMCHLTPNGKSHTINVAIESVPSHLSKGDFLGPCLP